MPSGRVENMGMIRVASYAGVLLALALLGGVDAQEAGAGHFFFYWPTLTAQCDVINLTWQNASPPFSFWILPVGQQPFMYHVPDSAYSGGQGTYPVQLQLNYGTNYITMMSDANGIGSGGTGEIQQVGSSFSTDCLNTASTNATRNDFSFQVAGVAEQCETGLQLSWNGADKYDPLNFTVLPLDQGFFPFDVEIGEPSSYINGWKMNLTTGTRFTVMMNDKNGYGRGGIAGIYQVSSSNDSSCVATQTQIATQTGSWPVGIATNTLAVGTYPADNVHIGHGLSGGAIAGIVIAAIAFILAVAFGAWWLMRRKRRRDAAAARSKGEGEEMDLAGGDSTDDTNLAPDPYRDLGTHPGPSEGGGEIGIGRVGGLGEGSRSGSFNSWHERNTLLPLDSATSIGASTAGFAGMGASSPTDGRGQYLDPYAPQFPREHPLEADILGEGERRSGPGTAGPLPRKTSPIASLPAGAAPAGEAFVARNPTISTMTSAGTGFGSAGTKATQGHGPVPQGPGAYANGAGRPPPPGGLRIANADDGDLLPSPISLAQPSPRRAAPRERDAQPRFRRHEDAGRVPLPGDEEGEVVDLPPLYSDVPRDHDPIMRGSSAVEDEVGEHQRAESGQSGRER